MALQIMHRSFPLQLPVFTTSHLQNQTMTLRRKKQFSCLTVQVCLQESSRKREQFGMTVQTFTGSYQQNKRISVFSSEVDTISPGGEKNACHFTVIYFR